MDASRFDCLTRSLVAPSSRRRLLHGLAVLGLAAGRTPALATAKKRIKRLKRNAFGCVNVGGRCKHARHCCSGICKGKKGKKRCKAHDGTSCQPGQRETACGGADVGCTTSQGFSGVCETTTGNGGFCTYAADCRECSRDADCRDVFGPLAACFPCPFCAQGTACGAPHPLK